jgi:hypothetical protein
MLDRHFFEDGALFFITIYGEMSIAESSAKLSGGNSEAARDTIIREFSVSHG